MKLSTKLGNWEVSLWIDAPPFTVLIPRQTHGNSIVSTASFDAGVPSADGIIGTLSGPAIGVHTADCLPLVLTTDMRALATHISRHTLTAGILETITDTLNGERILHAWMGPHICERCFVFEHRGEGIVEFERMFPYAVSEDALGTHLSLATVIRTYLRTHSVADATVFEDGRCTQETSSLPSYRRWKAQGGEGNFPRIITAVQYKKS